MIRRLALLLILLLPSVASAGDIVSNLEVRYVMNDNAGDANVVDSVAANTATFNGGDTSTKTTTGPTGSANSALILDGATDYISLPTAVNNLLQLTSSRTISVWIKITSYASTDEQYIISSTDSVTDSFRISYDDDTDILGGTFVHAGGTVSKSLASAAATLGNGWHHVAAVWNSTGPTLTIYVDNATISGTTAVTASGLADGVTLVGARNAGVDAVTGAVSNVRIYSRALAADDVADLYAEGSAAGFAVNPLGSGTPQSTPTTLDPLGF